MFLPFTQPWADAFREAINAGLDRGAAISAWRWPLALVLERAPEHGFTEDRAILLEIEDGVCRRAEVLDPAAATAPFTISGPYAAWKEVVRGTVDPVAAIMGRRLRLKGALLTLLGHVDSARALVACAAAVPTLFPDEA